MRRYKLAPFVVLIFMAHDLHGMGLSDEPSPVTASPAINYIAASPEGPITRIVEFLPTKDLGALLGASRDLDKAIKKFSAMKKRKDAYEATVMLALACLCPESSSLHGKILSLTVMERMTFISHLEALRIAPVTWAKIPKVPATWAQVGEWGELVSTLGAVSKEKLTSKFLKSVQALAGGMSGWGKSETIKILEKVQPTEFNLFVDHLQVLTKGLGEDDKKELFKALSDLSGQELTPRFMRRVQMSKGIGALIGFGRTIRLVQVISF